jgi:hypothetical protein
LQALNGFTWNGRSHRQERQGQKQGQEQQRSKHVLGT